MSQRTGSVRLGRQLRRLRLARGLSQRALARALGLSAHSNLVQYELGRRIPPSDLIDACERLLADDSGSLRRLRAEALAERAADVEPLAQHTPEDARVPEVTRLRPARARCLVGPRPCSTPSRQARTGPSTANRRRCRAISTLL